MLVGSDNATLSAIEGFAMSLDRHNASEYAQKHTWCLENMVNLIGDVAAQLKEQRLIFEYAPV
jgi:L-rhamnose mutarotase